MDEIIFRTSNKRNRLILERMARGGMRIGEVLNLRPRDIEGGRIDIQSPKTGRQAEIAFIPQKLANRLEEFIREHKIEPKERIFSAFFRSKRRLSVNLGLVSPCVLSKPTTRENLVHRNLPVLNMLCQVFP